jgi:alanyl-tRNA synthetase
MEGDLTPYRVIVDHARAAAFLIADGVVPGNIGRNYVCRMIIRRAARFGTKLGLHDPFLAEVAREAIRIYGDFYPELRRNQGAILSNLTSEEERFQRTVESGVAKLENLLNRLESMSARVLPGEQAFDLYATYGLPLEITRDIARERGMMVDESGFRAAMEEHRLASGAGEAFGPLGGEDVDVYRALFKSLVEQGNLEPEGVHYDPYNLLEVEGPVLGLIHANQVVAEAKPGDAVEVLLPETGFYVESGGQVSDTGTIVHAEGSRWEIRVSEMRKPAAGVIVHAGEVMQGEPRAGDLAIARVDVQRRVDIMRNHTATHLLHAELQALLGEHARQAGSLVAPDHLRFDFNHPQAVTPEQLDRIEAGVNRSVLENYALHIQFKPLQQAISEGATALFGEKYGEIVRNITIGEPEIFSNELCGGTHVRETGDIGLFLITSESSAAAGIRRIVAVTGRAAYGLVRTRFQALKQASALLDVSPEEVPGRTKQILAEIDDLRHELSELRRRQVVLSFQGLLGGVHEVNGVPLLSLHLPNTDADTLRTLSDLFRQRYPSGVCVLGSVSADGRPVAIAAVGEDLVKRGLSAVELAKLVASHLGGGGGGRPTLAQAGGKDPGKMDEALAQVKTWLEQKTA